MSTGGTGDLGFMERLDRRSPTVLPGQGACIIIIVAARDVVSADRLGLFLDRSGWEATVCGRYTLKTPSGFGALVVRLPGELTLEPRYNIAPSQPVAAMRLRADRAERELVMLHWGLIPAWAGDPSIGNRLINARAETVMTKPAFGPAFRQRRCLVLADGFFEWQRVGRTKQPFYVHMQDAAPFTFAGLWERWKGEDGTVIESCTLLTTEPNELLRPVHDRMPVILGTEHHDAWLDLSVRSDDLRSLLKPYPPDAMTLYPVSRRVNDPRNDDPGCIEPLR